MTAATSLVPFVVTRPRWLLATLAGGGVDAVYATAMAVSAGQSALKPWQGVASGWQGRATAMDGGAAAAMLGLVTHFGIAAAMAGVWLALAGRAGFVARRPVLCAVAYGLGLYVAMSLIVLPLRWPEAFPRWHGVRSILDIAAHVAVALAIAAVGRPRQARP